LYYTTDALHQHNGSIDALVAKPLQG